MNSKLLLLIPFVFTLIACNNDDKKKTLEAASSAPKKEANAVFKGTGTNTSENQAGPADRPSRKPEEVTPPATEKPEEPKEEVKSEDTPKVEEGKKEEAKKDPWMEFMAARHQSEMEMERERSRADMMKSLTMLMTQMMIVESNNKMIVDSVKASESSGAALEDDCESTAVGSSLGNMKEFLGILAGYGLVTQATQTSE